MVQSELLIVPGEFDCGKEHLWLLHVIVNLLSKVIRHVSLHDYWKMIAVPVICAILNHDKADNSLR